MYLVILYFIRFRCTAAMCHDRSETVLNHQNCFILLQRGNFFRNLLSVDSWCNILLLRLLFGDFHI